MQTNCNPYQQKYATAIVAPNFTQIPNIVFDYWMPILSPAEFKVLLAICRKTFGWQKLEDRISAKQLEKITGLSKNTILLAIEKLISYELVTKIKSKTTDGDDAPNLFAIHVFEPQCQDQTLGGGSAEIALGVVQNLHWGVVQNLHPQKKDPTKERHTKETTPLPPEGEAAIAAQGVVDSSSPSTAKKGKVRDNVLLAPAEQAKLLADYGDAKLAQMLDILDAYKGSSGKRYKSDYHTLLPSGWVHKRWTEEKDLPKASNLAPHRKNSKLAFETTKDDWVPTPIAPSTLSADQRAAIMEELRFKS